MPLLDIHRLHEGALWARWRISEPIGELKALYPIRLAAEQEEWARISAPSRQVEWLAGRLTLQALLAHAGVPFTGVYKDAHGCPLLPEGSVHVSLSHSKGRYAVAQVSRSGPTGIDLEQVADKPLRIAHRFLSEQERAWAATSPLRATMAWCVKEALYKRFGRHRLSFRNDMEIAPFKEDDKTLSATVRAEGETHLIRLFATRFDGFSVVGCL